YVDEGLWKRLVKVFFVAVLNGVLLSVIVFGANVLLFGEHELSMVVSLALISDVVFASFIGTITPLVLNHLDLNPALASGPFITTMYDLLGLTVYFFTVHILLYCLHLNVSLSIQCTKVFFKCCKTLDGISIINLTSPVKRSATDTSVVRG